MKKLFLTLVVAVATVMTANASGYEYSSRKAMVQ